MDQSHMLNGIWNDVNKRPIHYLSSLLWLLCGGLVLTQSFPAGLIVLACPFTPGTRRFAGSLLAYTLVGVVAIRWFFPNFSQEILIGIGVAFLAYRSIMPLISLFCQIAGHIVLTISRKIVGRIRRDAQSKLPTASPSRDWLLSSVVAFPLNAFWFSTMGTSDDIWALDSIWTLGAAIMLLFGMMPLQLVGFLLVHGVAMIWAGVRTIFYRVAGRHP